MLGADAKIDLVGNSGPYLVPEPKADITAYIGKSFSHSFGKAYDIEGDAVKINVDLGRAYEFANFDFITNSLTIAEGATNLRHPRFTTITMTLTDDNPIVSVTTYKFRLVLEELLAKG